MQELADVGLVRDGTHRPHLEPVQRLDHALQPREARRRGVGQRLHDVAVDLEVRFTTADGVPDPGQPRDVHLDVERTVVLVALCFVGHGVVPGSP
jgi:hypothetical protein